MRPQDFCLSSQNWNDDWQEKNHRCGTGLASLDRMNVAKSSTHERGWKINDPGIHHHITIPNSSSIFLEVPRSCGPSDCQKLSVLPSLNCSTPRFKNHSETARPEKKNMLLKTVRKGRKKWRIRAVRWCPSTVLTCSFWPISEPNCYSHSHEP